MGRDVVQREDNRPELACPLLAVFCGWPLSGKSTIAEKVVARLGFRHLDINTNIRVPVFGRPVWKPGQYEEFRIRDEEEMQASYELLLHATDIHLRLGKSVILTATFSRKSRQADLRAVYQKFPHAKVRLIWCRPQNDTEEEIRRRLSIREAEARCVLASGQEPYVDPSNSPERYLEVKRRFEPIMLSHLQIDTAPPRSADECADEALAYIIS